MIIYRPYPLYPLPEDYGSLTADGQRQARLAVLRDHSTPEKLVLAWDLYRRLYLGQSKDAVWYKNGYQESPEFHTDMVYDLGVYGRNAQAAPRGSAKSTVILECLMLLCTTTPFFTSTYCSATDDLVGGRLADVQMQFQANELIIQDFGNLVPKRGKGIWNKHHLRLTNGAEIKGLSVMGKKRGGRPKLFVLDDPEYDPEDNSETARLKIIERFEVILFKQIIPMLERGSSIFWVGTLIDRRAFLYRAIEGDDPRFDFWNRKRYKARAKDKVIPGKYHYLWPNYWDAEWCEAKIEEIGPSHWGSEYQNEPVSAQERLLFVDPRKNEYTVEGELNWAAPLASTNIVKWNEREFGEDNDHRTYAEMSRKYNELVGPMFKVLLFDYASGLTSYHDYACIAVCGFDVRATMWLLHLWLGRAKEDTLMRLIYETGLIWQVRIIGIEAVPIQKSFAEAAQEYTYEQAGIRGDSWRPRVHPITYPAKETKAQRIASAMEWRFNSGRVKYPAHLKDKWPYNQAYAQTADFTMDLALLQHDDVIDTLGMHKYVVKTRGGQFKREKGVPSLKERIIKNQPEVPGLPVLSGVSSAEVTDEMMNVMSQQARKRNIQPRQRRIERPRPKIIR